MSNVVAFPGVILAERETGSAPPARPPVTSKPCPVCTAPIRSDDCEVIGCTRCRVEFHAPCFWRVLPISEWVVFLTWVYESPLEDLDKREYICVACRPAGDA
jgi:hypothetical protein